VKPSTKKKKKKKKNKRGTQTTPNKRGDFAGGLGQKINSADLEKQCGRKIGNCFRGEADVIVLGGRGEKQGKSRGQKKGERGCTSAG